MGCFLKMFAYKGDTEWIQDEENIKASEYWIPQRACELAGLSHDPSNVWDSKPCARVLSDGNEPWEGPRAFLSRLKSFQYILQYEGCDVGYNTNWKLDSTAGVTRDCHDWRCPIAPSIITHIHAVRGNSLRFLGISLCTLDGIFRLL